MDLLLTFELIIKWSQRETHLFRFLSCPTVCLTLMSSSLRLKTLDAVLIGRESYNSRRYAHSRLPLAQFHYTLSEFRFGHRRARRLFVAKIHALGLFRCPLRFRANCNIYLGAFQWFSFLWSRAAMLSFQSKTKRLSEVSLIFRFSPRAHWWRWLHPGYCPAHCSGTLSPLRH